MTPLDRRRRTALLAAATLVACCALAAPASAARLLTSYDLDGTLAASYAVWFENGDDPAVLGTVGGTPAFVQEASILAPRKGVADLAAGQGLVVPSRAYNERDQFTLAVSFRVDVADPDAAAGTIVPVLSFDGGASGTGLVVRDGVLGWWNAGSTTFTALGGAIADGAWQSVAVGRAPSGTVTLDRDGASATVPAAAATPSTFGSQVQIFGPGSGTAQVARVRTWDDTLSPEELAPVLATVVDTSAPVGLSVVGAGWYSDEDGAPVWIGPSASPVAFATDDGTGPLDLRWSLRSAGCASLAEQVPGESFVDEDSRDRPFTVGFAPSDGLVDGATYEACVSAVDRRGNVAAASRTVRVDAVAPVLTVDTPSTDGAPRISGTVGTAERDLAEIDFQLLRGEAPISGDDPDEWDRRIIDYGRLESTAGRWSRDLRGMSGPLLSSLADGAYRLRVSQCDTVYNCTTVEQVIRVVRRAVIFPRTPIVRIGPHPPAAPAPAPVLPATPPVVSPEQLAQQLTEQLLTSTVRTFAKGGLAGIAKPRQVPVTVTGPGTVQIQQFSGAAPKKVTVLASTAKRGTKKAALPANLLGLGSRTFANAGAGVVTVSPSTRAKRVAKGKRRLTVTVRVVFRPAGGAPVARDRKVTLGRGR